MKKFIHIPQKCLGIITPKTSEEFGGMYTEGLATCSGVVVSIAKGNWFILCHADDQTDLATGLPWWLGRIPRDGGTVVVEYDLPPGEKHDVYAPQLEKAIDSLGTELRRNVKLQLSPISVEGVRIYREDGKIIREGCPSDALEKEEKQELVGGEMGAYIGNIYNFLGTNSYPPICVFDGRSVLSTDNIKAQHPALAPAFEATERLFPPASP